MLILRIREPFGTIYWIQTATANTKYLFPMSGNSVAGQQIRNVEIEYREQIILGVKGTLNVKEMCVVSVKSFEEEHVNDTARACVPIHAYAV